MLQTSQQRQLFTTNLIINLHKQRLLPDNKGFTNFTIKTIIHNQTTMPAQIYHFDLYGKRNDKYDFLANNSVETVNWTQLNPDPKYHFLYLRILVCRRSMREGFKVSELFKVFNSGVKTDRDSLFMIRIKLS
jgi:hypothetical protein